MASPSPSGAAERREHSTMSTAGPFPPQEPTASPHYSSYTPAQMQVPQQQQPQYQQQQVVTLMYPYQYPPMSGGGYAVPSSASQSGSYIVIQQGAPPSPGQPHQPHAFLQHVPQLQGQPQQQQHDPPAQAQMQQQQQYAPHAPLYVSWNASTDEQQQQQQMGAGVYLTSEALAQNSLLAPAPAMLEPQAAEPAEYAEGIPTVNLGLRVAMAPVRKILILYVLLVVFLLISIAIFISTWFTPISRNQITIGRSMYDVLPASTYKTEIGGDEGANLAVYARYAPCTVLKQYGCDVFTDKNAAYWMTMVQGIKNPFADAISVAGFNEPKIVSCLTFKGDSYDNTLSRLRHGSAVGELRGQNEAAGVDSVALLDEAKSQPLRSSSETSTSLTEPSFSLSPNAWKDTTGNSDFNVSRLRFLPAPKGATSAIFADVIPLNASGVYVQIETISEEAAEAGFFLTCNTDAKTVNMLNLTAVVDFNLTGLIDITSSYITFKLDANTFFSAAEDFIKVRFLNYTYTTCADYYLSCTDPSMFILFAATSELRRCIGKPVADGYSNPFIDATVVVCDTLPRETAVDPKIGSDVIFTVTGVFYFDLTMYARMAYLYIIELPINFDIDVNTVLLIVFQSLMVVAVALNIIAANIIPLQRFKLRQLRAALEVDASMAMEILYRVQGVFPGPSPFPPLPMPAPQPTDQAIAAEPVDDSAAASATQSEAQTQPHAAEQPQMPPNAMFVTSPYYQLAAGMEMMRMGGAMAVAPQQPMIMAPPYAHPQRPPSPYGEGHYLPQHGTDSEAADAEAEGAGVEAQRSGDASSVHTAAHHNGSAASLCASDKHDSDAAAFAEPVGVVSPAEVRLRGAAAGPRTPPPSDDDDAQELQSLYSAASLPPSEHAASVRPPPPPAPPSLEEQQRIRMNPALLSRGAAQAQQQQMQMQQQQMQPMQQPASVEQQQPNTDWMFAQTRHLVSPDVLEETAPGSTPAPSRLHQLRDRLLHRRRRATTGGASVPAGFPASDSDDGLDGHDAPPERPFAGPESSPGERTIQLFVTRARNSYRRLRRKQVKTLSNILLYANVIAIIAAILAALTMGFQLSGIFDDFAGKAQIRFGDTIVIRRRLSRDYAGQFAVALASLLVVIALSIVIQATRVW